MLCVYMTEMEVVTQFASVGVHAATLKSRVFLTWRLSSGSPFSVLIIDRRWLRRAESHHITMRDVVTSFGERALHFWEVEMI